MAGVYTLIINFAHGHSRAQINLNDCKLRIEVMRKFAESALVSEGITLSKDGLTIDVWNIPGISDRIKQGDRRRLGELVLILMQDILGHEYTYNTYVNVEHLNPAITICRSITDRIALDPMYLVGAFMRMFEGINKKVEAPTTDYLFQFYQANKALNSPIDFPAYFAKLAKMTVSEKFTHKFKPKYSEFYLMVEATAKRLEISHNFLYSALSIKDLSYKHHEEKSIYPCASVSDVKRLADGDYPFRTQEEITKMFHEVSYGLFLKSPNPEFEGREFPWEYCVLAGGLICDLAMKNGQVKKSSDVDIYITRGDPVTKKQMMTHVAKWFYKPSATYYAVIGSVVSIYIEGINRKFQIITADIQHPYDIVSSYDMSIAKLVLSCHNRMFILQGTASAIISASNGLITMDSLKHFKIIRILKYLIRGFDILKTETTEAMMGINSDDLLSNPNNDIRKQTLREIYSYYFPPQVESREDRFNVIKNIEQDAATTAIYESPTDVTNNIVLTGNFNTYSCRLYKTFNRADIVHVDGRARNTVTLSTFRGKVMLLSPPMEILTYTNVTRDGVRLADITFKVTDPDFIEFTKMLDVDIYRLYCVNPVTRNIVHNGQIKMAVLHLKPNGKLKSAVQAGVGQIPIDQLGPGDVVSMVFNIIIHKYLGGFAEDRFVELSPVKFIVDKKVHTESVESLSSKVENPGLLTSLANKFSKMVYGDDQ